MSPIPSTSSGYERIDSPASTDSQISMPWIAQVSSPNSEFGKWDCGIWAYDLSEMYYIGLVCIP